MEQFDPSTLYNNGPNLEGLQEPITEQEIETIVFSLANNQASGSDGLSSEFTKVYWNEIKVEALQLLKIFFNELIDLRPLNTVNIVMIPKKKPMQWN